MWCFPSGSVDEFCVIPSLPPLLGVRAAHPHQGYPVKRNSHVFVWNYFHCVTLRFLNAHFFRKNGDLLFLYILKHNIAINNRGKFHKIFMSTIALRVLPNWNLVNIMPDKVCSPPPNIPQVSTSLWLSWFQVIGSFATTSRRDAYLWFRWVPYDQDMQQNHITR